MGKCYYTGSTRESSYFKAMTSNESQGCGWKQMTFVEPGASPDKLQVQENHQFSYLTEMTFLIQKEKSWNICVYRN